MELVWPAQEYLPGYAAALKRGWSPDNLRPEVARQELEQIAADPAAFLRAQVDREAKSPSFTLPDGTVSRRLPGYNRWMWDGEFCGSINFRWQPRSSELPPKRNRGYATLALKLLLSEAKAEGLEYVELTSSPENVASHRVIEANGGVLGERFAAPWYGPGERLRFRIDLD